MEDFGRNRYLSSRARSAKLSDFTPILKLLPVNTDPEQAMVEDTAIRKADGEDKKAAWEQAEAQ